LSFYWIILIAVVVGGGSFFLYRRFVLRPRRIALENHLVKMISDWFSHIEDNFNQGVDKKFLSETETKILEFIEGTALRSFRLYFTPSFQSKFLEQHGHKKGINVLADREALFFKVIGVNVIRIDLPTYWLNVKRSFYQFYWNYTGEDFRTYINQVEVKVDLLKMYFGYNQPVKP